jgi:hypothetical protein
MGNIPLSRRSRATRMERDGVCRFDRAWATVKAADIRSSAARRAVAKAVVGQPAGRCLNVVAQILGGFDNKWWVQRGEQGSPVQPLGPQPDPQPPILLRDLFDAGDSGWETPSEVLCTSTETACR